MATAVFLLWPSINDQAKVSARVQSDDAGRTSEMYRQVVRLGGAESYSVYAQKGVTATGDSQFRGSVGIGAGAKFEGVSESLRGNPDADVATVGSDLAKAYSALRQLPCTTVDDNTLSNKTFGAGIYCVSGTKLDGEMIFDAEGDQNAIMAIRVIGDLDIAAGARISLVNGAQAHNVRIAVDGNALIGPGADVRASILAKGNIEALVGSSVKGRTISVEGKVTSTGAELGNGTGRLEICKQLTPGSGIPTTQNFTFTFPAVGGGNQSVTIQPGTCSFAREVISGDVTVTESVNGTFGIASASAVRVGGVNVPVAVNTLASTATVNVLEGDFNNETTLTVVNQPLRAGFIEICKFPSAITAPTATPQTPSAAPENPTNEVIEGVFEFRIRTFPGTNLQSVFVPIGGCSQILQVTSFTTTTTDPTFVTRIQEVGRTGILLEAVTTNPIGRSVVVPNSGFGVIGQGGSVDVTVSVGGANLQTIVNFFNREAPAEIKVCKVAGPGVDVNTAFTFNVSGTAPGGTSTSPTFPGSLITRQVVVRAGPGPEGFCQFVRNVGDTANQTFVVGRRVTIEELPLSVNGAPTIVSRIEQFNAGAPVVRSLEDRRISFEILPGVGIVRFTNTRFSPVGLKVCKVGTGTASNLSFTFDLFPSAAQAGSFEPGFNFGSVTVPAGSCSAPITGFPADLDILVDERAVTNITNTAIDAPSGAGSIILRNLGLGQGTIDLTTNATVNEIIFTNNGTIAPPPTPTPTPTPAVRSVDYDFDGDRKADPSVFRSSNGSWWVLQSGSGTTRAGAFGLGSDIIVPGDYDGDAKTDYAVFRNGEWHILGSTIGYTVGFFGSAGDLPQAGDFDGDGKSDLVVYRPSSGVWYIMGSTTGFRAVQFGISTDRPVAADYDGDGRMDPAVYRNGEWYILGSTAGFSGFQFGVASDRPIPADYDGDGRADAAVYRGGTWYMLRSTAGFTAGQFGVATDKPVPADYDGDGRADLAVFRPSDGVWHIMRSSATESGAGYTSVSLGISTDTPIPY